MCVSLCVYRFVCMCPTRHQSHTTQRWYGTDMNRKRAAVCGNWRSVVGKDNIAAYAQRRVAPWRRMCAHVPQSDCENPSRTSAACVVTWRPDCVSVCVCSVAGVSGICVACVRVLCLCVCVCASVCWLRQLMPTDFTPSQGQPVDSQQMCKARARENRGRTSTRL